MTPASSAPERLFAYLHEPRGLRQVGVFERSEDRGVVSFRYLDSDPSGTPLSLSLPRDRPHRESAAVNYLRGLLPDDRAVRARWARDAKLAKSTAMGLLARFGEDIGGAVSLSPSDDLVVRTGEPLHRATDEDIAVRIRAMREDATAWHSPQIAPRMSLAGQQPKFSIRRTEDGLWFWPNWENPSTHIIKPPATRHPGLDELESATLKLAVAIGIAASEASVLNVKGAQAFIVKRWDRADDGQTRLHSEDLNQAMGRAPEQKYSVSAPAVINFLRSHNLDTTPFLRQLAFNTYVGNTDAHAKNYSLLLDGPNIALSGLYDTFPVIAYPRHDNTLSMKIGNNDAPSMVTPTSWTKLANESGLDSDYVLATVLPVRDAVIEKFEDYIDLAAIDRNGTHKVNKHLRKLAKDAETNPAPTAASNPLVGNQAAVVHSDEIHVEAYVRKDGTHVAAHTRRARVT